VTQAAIAANTRPLAAGGSDLLITGTQ